MNKTEALAFYKGEVDKIKADGLFKSERTIASPQGANIQTADGAKMINMCANNYLGLANSPEAHYNALNHESENKTNNITQQFALGDERSQNGETGIRTERGLHDTDASDGRTAGGNSNEIRIDETAVPQGTQKRNLYGISVEGNFERTSSDDSGTGRGENGSIGGTDGKSGGRDRTAQSR